MHKFFLNLIIISFLCTILVAPTYAEPITYGNVFSFVDNEGANPVGTGQGVNYSLGINRVSPDSQSGTTAYATNIATSYPINPLPDLSSQGRPGIFATDIPYSFAQTNNLLSSWKITLTNGNDTLEVITWDRSNVQKMEFVQNLSISGPATSPTVTWVLPTSGATVSRVSYELWNVDTKQIMSGQTSVPIGATAVKLTLNNYQLQEGTNYAIRITPEQLSNGVASRSSNWLAWEARSGEASGTVLELTTGSPAGVSQVVNTPNNTFKVEFDYRFTTTTGFLEVFLDNNPIGTKLEAAETIYNDFFHAVFEVEDPSLFNLSNVLLLFKLDGLLGSSIQIDNIIFPGLINGDFERGLSQWIAVGPGNISTKPVPEPATMLLLCVGLVGLAGYGRSKFRTY